MPTSVDMLEAERQNLELERQKITITRQKTIVFCLSSKYHILTKVIKEVYFVCRRSKNHKLKTS